MIDPNYPSSPLDPPYCLRGRPEDGAFRAGDALVVHGSDRRAWLRSDTVVELGERR